MVTGWRLSAHSQRRQQVKTMHLPKEQQKQLEMSLFVKIALFCRLNLFDLPENALEREAVGSSAERNALSSSADTYQPALCFSEGETIYDYVWFPAMHSEDPVSCVLAATSRVSSHCPHPGLSSPSASNVNRQTLSPRYCY